MDLKTLSSFELEMLLKNKVSQERQLTVEIINLLEEISARQIHLQRGFGSLMEYCVKELGYSESSAYRRISAMRVAQTSPEVKEALAVGRLSLVTVAKAQTLFKKEEKENKPLTAQEKSDVLKKLQNKSTREAEKILLSISPMQVPKEKVREVSSEQTQISVVLSEDMMKKLNEIKNLWSHKNPHPSYAQLFEMLADFTLQKIKSTASKTQGNTSVVKCRGESKSLLIRTAISQTIKKQIWQKANKRCEFRDSITGRRCESKFQLEIEHKHPVAKGGTNNPSNLEILCRAHNQLRAREHFGKTQMERFFNKKLYNFPATAHFKP